MDGRSANLFCRVKPGLEIALLASTTAYGASCSFLKARLNGGSPPKSGYSLAKAGSCASEVPGALLIQRAHPCSRRCPHPQSSAVVRRRLGLKDAYENGCD